MSQSPPAIGASSLGTGARNGPASGLRFAVLADDAGEGFSTERIQAIRHNFHEHPLMQLPELARLATV